MMECRDSSSGARDSANFWTFRARGGGGTDTECGLDAIAICKWREHEAGF